MRAVGLPKEIEQRLATLAERTGPTKTYAVREAVLAHLEDMEDYSLFTRCSSFRGQDPALVRIP